MNSLKKKGVSPVIATILLVVLVIIIAIIIFLWFRGLTKEAITKFDGTNIRLVCDDVKFEASYSAGSLYVSNLGNVPIYNMDVKIEGDGSYFTESLKDTNPNDWPQNGLNQGGVFSGTATVGNSDTKITLIPVLMGLDKEGDRKISECEERHGYEIYL